MALERKEGEVCNKNFVITFEDYTSGTAVEKFALPAGATVLDVKVNVTTAWDAGTSSVISVGDGSSTGRFIATQDLQAAGAVTNTGLVYTYAAADTVDVLITDVGTANTQGSAIVSISYTKPGKSFYDVAV